jgi:hypothetical protein
MPWSSCPFVLVDPEFDGMMLSLQGMDPSVLLEQELDGVADVIGDKDPPDYAYSHKTIKDFYAAKGITVQCDYPDFRLREQRRGKGQAIVWCKQAQRPYGALESWNGSTLVLRPPGELSQMSPEFYLVAHQHVETFNLRINSQMITGTKVARLEPQAGQIGAQDCKGGDCPRIWRVPVTPSRNIRGEVRKVVNGALENVSFLAGDTVAGIDLGDQNSIGYRGELLADTVQFTYRINFSAASPWGGGGATAYVPEFDIVFWGGAGNGAGEFDTQFTAEYNDTATEARFRIQRETSALEDPIIPNYTVALAYARSYVRENTRKYWQVSAGVPFLNPHMRTGSCIALTHCGTSQVNQKWFIQERTLSLRRGKKGAGLFGYMTLELTKRADD